MNILKESCNDLQLDMCVILYHPGSLQPKVVFGKLRGCIMTNCDSICQPSANYGEGGRGIKL